MTTLHRVLSALVVIVVVLSLLVAWFFGPALGLALRGQPFFLLPPSPQRYAAVILDRAESLGLYGDSEEFARARADVEKQAATAEDPADLHAALDAALVAAGGRHSALIPAERVEENIAAEPSLPEVSREGDILFARVPAHNVNHDGQRYADLLAAGLTQPACGAVLDLRGNSGGDMGPMLAGLSPLLDDGVVLQHVSRFDTTDVVIDGNAVSGAGTPTTASGGKNPVPVALLTDEGTASAGEGVVLSFTGAEDARTFGSPTAGVPSANIGFSMNDGAAVLITVAATRDRTGREHAEEALVPDVETGEPEAAAREWLATDHGC
ncbi:S41 family peptidase [Corynebacterium sp.]|uniref:S41 family peptidase n=1 Tax=Corynebacterium sp. TaxID=1720 RepID=UPI0026E02AC0|nr:S41 family peptidase [Corynebacterium sp.]MDO5511370.1 S41 family peptidase [Corynebacterium sp.]